MAGLAAMNNSGEMTMTLTEAQVVIVKLYNDKEIADEEGKFMAGALLAHIKDTRAQGKTNHRGEAMKAMQGAIDRTPPGTNVTADFLRRRFDGCRRWRRLNKGISGATNSFPLGFAGAAAAENDADQLPTGPNLTAAASSVYFNTDTINDID